VTAFGTLWGFSANLMSTLSAINKVHAGNEVSFDSGGINWICSAHIRLLMGYSEPVLRMKITVYAFRLQFFELHPKKY
jgi:hypothetical protein